MKNILLYVILIMSTPAMADVFVVTDQNGYVVTVSEKNDNVVQEGQSVSVIKNKTIDSLGIDSDVKLYKFNGNKFSIDGVKVTKKRKNEEDRAVAVEKRKADRASGIEKLKAVGLSESEIVALIGG